MLLFGTVLLHGSGWRGSRELHTNMNLVASVLAFGMGLGALVRFLARKAPNFLFMGIGFLGTAALDSYHTVLGSSYWSHGHDIYLGSQLSWTWNSSQAFLAAMLLVSAGLGRLPAGGGLGTRTRSAFRRSIAIFALVCCWSFAIAPLNPASDFGVVADRCLEAGAAILFLAALYSNLRHGNWRSDAFEYWLVASLIVCLASQLTFMARSGQLFDVMFDLAHLLKIGGYGLVLAGVLCNGYQLFLQTDKQRHALAALNEKLRCEIEQREQAEAALRLSEQRFELAVEGSDTGLWDWPDVTKPTQWWSPRVYTLLGYEPGEITASAITFRRRLLDPEDSDRTQAAVESHLERGEPFDIEYRLRTKSGNPHWFRSRAKAFRTGGPEPVRMAGTIIDVHARKLAEAKIRLQAEELALVNEELEQFAYSASHDLQEPVRNLVAYCAMLREDLGPDLNDDAAADLNYIGEAASRMKTLIADLLALSRAGRQVLSTAPVEMEDCVRRSLDNLRTQILESDARIRWENLPLLPGDPTMLTQLYQNLLSNALKFCGNEPPEIDLTAKQENGHWILGVRDNGIGLDPKDADRIFNPFQRVHVLADFPGNGIGLAICRKTVERHGGKIWVESEPGRGSHFQFLLPALNSERQAARKPVNESRICNETSPPRPRC